MFKKNKILFQFLFLLWLTHRHIFAVASPSLADNSQISSLTEELLPTSIKARAVEIRKQAFNRYSEEIYKKYEVSKESRQRSVTYGGILAQHNDILAYAFFENGLRDDRSVHIVLGRGEEATPIKSVPDTDLCWMDRIDGFVMDRPLIWIEDFNDGSGPLLAIRHQYHNGTGNAIIVSFYSIKVDLGLKLAFCVEEKAVDLVTWERNEERVILRKVVSRRSSSGKISLAVEVNSVGKMDSKNLGEYGLRKSSGGKFTLGKVFVKNEDDRRRIVTAGIDVYSVDDFVSKGKGYN